MPPVDMGRRVVAFGDDRLEHRLGAAPTTRAIVRGRSLNADLCRRRRARREPSLSWCFHSRPRSSSRISRKESRTGPPLDFLAGVIGALHVVVPDSPQMFGALHRRILDFFIASSPFTPRAKA